MSEECSNPYGEYSGHKFSSGSCIWCGEYSAIAIVKESYDYPNHAWETRYAADIGKRKLLNVLRYLANPDRYARPKNRVYRSNRPDVNNLWDA